jgi:hypothetical protein
MQSCCENGARNAKGVTEAIPNLESIRSCATATQERQSRLGRFQAAAWGFAAGNICKTSMCAASKEKI